MSDLTLGPFPFTGNKALLSCLLVLVAVLSSCASAPGAAPDVGVPVLDPPPAAPGPRRAAPDEDDPATHIARLRVPQLRVEAMGRLESMMNGAMAAGAYDPESPQVKALGAAIARPLSDICVEKGLDASLRDRIVGVLAQARHRDTVPCMIHALASHDLRGSETAATLAAEAVRALHATEAKDALLALMAKMWPSRAERSYYPLCEKVGEAMVALADPSWESALLGLLALPVTDSSWEDTNKGPPQTPLSAVVRILGDLRSEKAIEPLLRVMVTPSRAGAHRATARALLRIGKPALAPSVALMKGEPKELAEYAKVEYKESIEATATKEEMARLPYAHVAAAATVLGVLGREEGRTAMLDVIGKVDPITRALVASKLPYVPRSPGAIKAFRKAFEDTAVGLDLQPNGMLAQQLMLVLAPGFFDADLVPWLARVAAAAKGGPAEVYAVRTSAFYVMSSLALPKQASQVDKVAKLEVTLPDGSRSTAGAAFEEMTPFVQKALLACKEDAGCYLSTIETTKAQGGFEGAAVLKSAYMAGVLGSEGLRPRLVATLAKADNTTVRVVLASALDVLSPKGDAALADQLQAVVDDVDRRKDLSVLGAQDDLRDIVLRLRLRAN